MTIAYDLKIGTSVLTADGEVGRLRTVVVDPESDMVTYLVVEHATPDGIFLHLTSQEVARQPLYREERFVAPPPDWEPLPGYGTMDVLFWGAPYGGVAPPILPMMEYTIRYGIPGRTAVLERHTEVRTRDGALEVRALDLAIEPLVPVWLDMPR